MLLFLWHFCVRSNVILEWNRLHRKRGKSYSILALGLPRFQKFILGPINDFSTHFCLLWIIPFQTYAGRVIFIESNASIVVDELVGLAGKL